MASSATQEFFQAYTGRAIDWRIQVFASVGGILSVLDVKLPPDEYARRLAEFETRTQFARARLPGVTIASAGADAANGRVGWTIDNVAGSTYVLTERSKSFTTLSSVADMVAHARAEGCANQEKGSVENAIDGDIAPNIQTRSFACSVEGKTNTIGIVADEVDDVATVFEFGSASESAARALTGYLSDKAIVY